MAEFIPARRLTSPRSDGERRCLEWLDRLPDDVVVLHSLGVLSHPFKSWAEIDVLVVAPWGVLALEVKSGRVVRRQGRWGFTDRNNRTTWSNEGPFDQVGGASAALRNRMIADGVLSRSACWGYGVLFPDCTYSGAEQGTVPEVLLDASSSWAEPEGTLRRWCRFWGRRSGRSAPLDADQLETLLEAVRGDLDMQPLPALEVAGVNEQLGRLTRQQDAVLLAARAAPRLVVTGRAGTGKTILALKECTRLVADGSVLLLTSGKLLERRCRDALAGRTGIEVRRVQAPDTWPSEPSAAVVIDEAQDAGDVRSLLDRLCVGGSHGGTWRVFLDPAQRLLHGQTDSRVDDASALNAYPLALTLNCRNTRQIAVFASMLTRIRLELEAPALGPDVHVAWFESDHHHDDLLVTALKREAASDVKVAVIWDEAVPSERLHAVESAAAVRFHSPAGPPGRVSLATAQQFKGLEADSVIIAGVRQLDEARLRRQMYVASTRARSRLTVLLSREVRPLYEQGAAWLAQELMDPLSADTAIDAF